MSILLSYAHLFITFFLLNHENNKSLTPGLLYEKGDRCYYDEDFEQAIKYYRFAVTGFQASENMDSLSNSLNDIGLCYYKLGIVDSALYYYDLALDIDRKLPDSTKWAGRLRNIGIVYQEMGNFSLATKHILESKDISDIRKDYKNKFAANTLLGNIYLDQDKFDMALSEFNESLEGYKMLKDSIGIGLAYNNIGLAYLGKKQFDNALFFFKNSLDLKTRYDNSLSQAFTYHNLGITHLSLSNFSKAEKKLLEAFHIRKRINDLRNLAHTANALAELYNNWQKTNLVEKFLNQALTYAYQYGNQSILFNNLRVRSDYMKSMGKPDSALHYFQLWSAMRDSIFNAEKLVVQKLISQYDLDKKEGERLIEERKANFERNQSADRLMVIWIVSGLAILLLTFVLVIYIQRKRIYKLNRELRLINTDMFHRKRNDYSRILDLLEKNSFAQTDTIRNMLFASATVDEALYQSTDKNLNLKAYLQLLAEDLSEALIMSEKQVKLNLSVASISLKSEKAVKIAFIICELITNSVKHSFCNTTGKVEFKIIEEKQHLHISYTDNGEAFSNKNKIGMGSQLIQSFLTSLNTSMTRSYKNGLNRVEFSIKLQES